MKTIELNNGFLAIVDDDNFEELSKHKWYCDHKGYAKRSKDSIFMHRIILNASKGTFTDHINGNPLDNRKDNLRICTNSQNQMNRHKKKNGCSSIYKGVYLVKNRNKWFSQIFINSKRVFLGLFDKEIDAAMAYDNKAKELFGEFACLNFNNK